MFPLKSTGRATLTAAAIASMLPLFSASPAVAATGCEMYTDIAVEAANKVRELACGFDLSNPQWSTNPEHHRRWCRFASQDSVDHEMANRSRKISECSVCRAYANAAMAAVAVNNLLRCGFSGPAWNNKPEAHFNWCMGLKSSRSYLEGIEKSIYEIQRESLDPQTAARTQAAEQCKLTHKADQALALLSPALQPNVQPSGVSVIPNIQMPAPQGTATPDKAVPSRSSARYGNIRITPRNIATCRSPCRPSSTGFGRVLLKNNPGVTLQRAVPMGGTRVLMKNNPGLTLQRAASIGGMRAGGLRLR
jgi:hypothetical protein